MNSCDRWVELEIQVAIGSGKVLFGGEEELAGASQKLDADAMDLICSHIGIQVNGVDFHGCRDEELECRRPAQIGGVAAVGVPSGNTPIEGVFGGVVLHGTAGARLALRRAAEARTTREAPHRARRGVGSTIGLLGAQRVLDARNDQSRASGEAERTATARGCGRPNAPEEHVPALVFHWNVADGMLPVVRIDGAGDDAVQRHEGFHRTRSVLGQVEVGNVCQLVEREAVQCLGGHQHQSLGRFLTGLNRQLLSQEVHDDEALPG